MKKQTGLLLGDAPSNILFKGDCLPVLRNLNDQYGGGFVDLVYIDPPFNSGQKLRYPHGKVPEVAFDDTWGGYDYRQSLKELAKAKVPGEHCSGEQLAEFVHRYEAWFNNPPAASYLTAMAARLPWIRRMLKESGSFYLHCDPTMSHALKLLCDMVFGRANFRNEIVWYYGGPSKAALSFPNKHDVLLIYSKSAKMLFNKLHGELPAYLKDRARTEPDGKMWVDQRLGKLKPETIKKMENEGRIFKTRTGGLRRKQFLDEMAGAQVDDVWGMPIINSQSKERVGYPTQKPLALAERIISASSNEGDLVADFFCGCGTTVAAAHKLGRKWIGCDISSKAVGVIEKRLRNECGVKVETHRQGEKVVRARGGKNQVVVEVGEPQTEQEAKVLARDNWEEFERWVVEDLLHAKLNTQRPQRNFDGKYFHGGVDGKRQTCLIEVKGGKANIGQVQAFAQTLELQRAAIGVFVCFRASGGMGGVADSMGHLPDTNAPRLQIVTIAQLLSGYRPKLPAETWPV